MKYNIINADGEVINTIVYDKDAIDVAMAEYDQLMLDYETKLIEYNEAQEDFYQQYDGVAEQYLAEKKKAKDNGLVTTPELRRLKRELNKVPRPPSPPQKPKKPIGHFTPPNGCTMEPVT